MKLEGSFMMINSSGKGLRGECEARPQIRARAARLSTTFFLEDRAISSKSFLEDQVLLSKKFLEDANSISKFFLEHLTYRSRIFQALGTHASGVQIRKSDEVI